MNRYRYLLKNIGLLTLSSFATKLLSFFLVPLYTNILTTTEYGTFDLFNATIGVLLPIFTLNIQEAVLRFSLDKKTSKKAIASISTKYLLIGNLLIIIGLGINQLLEVSSIVADYTIFFWLMFSVQALAGVITCYVRGIDKVGDLSISSIITSVITICCNILFLIGFKWGLVGYFLANIIGPLFQCVYLVIRSGFFKIVSLNRYEVEEKEMTNYSKPLIANSIAWWINNVSDRYVIVFFCGLAENGIYSVAGKIPSILNIFQTIFNQAWTLSAVKDFDPDDESGFFTNTYKAYNCMMTIVCSGIILTDKIFAKFLYAKDFYLAWRYVPWLTIAILFGALSGYLGGFFSAVKDSKIFARSTMIGAIVNLGLNILFTPLYGAMGAAVATAICYMVVWIIRYQQSKKYIRIKVNLKRDIITYILLIFQSILILMDGIKMHIWVGSLFVGICLLYMEDIKLVFEKIVRSRVKNEYRNI